MSAEDVAAQFDTYISDMSNIYLKSIGDILNVSGDNMCYISAKSKPRSQCLNYSPYDVSYAIISISGNCEEHNTSEIDPEKIFILDDFGCSGEDNFDFRYIPSNDKWNMLNDISGIYMNIYDNIKTEFQDTPSTSALDATGRFDKIKNLTYIGTDLSNNITKLMNQNITTTMKTNSKFIVFICYLFILLLLLIFLFISYKFDKITKLDITLYIFFIVMSVYLYKLYK